MNHPFRIVEDPQEPPEDPEADPRPDLGVTEVAAAEAEAATRAAEAQKRAQIRAEARDEGHAEGLKQGRAEALAAIEAAIGPAVERLEAARARLEAERAEDRDAMIRTAVRIGKSLAESLVGAPRPFDRAYLLAEVVDQVRAEVSGDAAPRIVCRAAPPTLTEIATALPDTLELVEDADMKPGGFVIELRDPQVGDAINRWDASVERMQQVIRNLNPEV